MLLAVRVLVKSSAANEGVAPSGAGNGVLADVEWADRVPVGLLLPLPEDVVGVELCREDMSDRNPM